jgi:hypothetical protein
MDEISRTATEAEIYLAALGEDLSQYYDYFLADTDADDSYQTE